LQAGLINEGFGQGDQTELSSAFWETAFLLTDSTSGIDEVLFLRFSTIFGEKMAFFSKTKCYDQNFA
jgi:hypothetical protein